MSKGEKQEITSKEKANSHPQKTKDNFQNKRGRNNYYDLFLFLN